MIQKKILKYISNIVAYIFPAYCYICRKEREPLCVLCLQQRVKSIDTPAPYITSFYSYKDPQIKKIIHAIKYFHRRDLLAPFAKIIASEIKKNRNYTSYMLIPIPMPKLRKLVRGHNHSETLANMIGEEVLLPVRSDLLLRNTSTSKKRQVTKNSRAERLKNQHDAFITNSKVKNLNIILIDDVTTTGATLYEARKILLVHGATSVMAITIAH